MKAYLYQAWGSLRTSFWFVPALMALTALGLAFLMLALDRRLDQDAPGFWGYAGGAEGGRAVLGAVAGSIMTVTGTVFSITIAALTLASSQFGPRLLRTFMRDLGNQIVLGTFIGTFLYCLIVLRWISGQDATEFVPHLSIGVGITLGVLSICVLIYFIHHAATSIQAEHVIAAVANELDESIDRLYPERVGAPAGDQAEMPVSWAAEGEVEAVPAPSSGYLQLIDGDALLDTARRAGVRLAVAQRPGAFVTAGTPLIRLPAAERISPEVSDQIARAFVLGGQRTAAQDILFSIDQLVEIAVRALSPGVNDPFTAISCIDRLSAALSRLAQRRPPVAVRADEHGTPRVVAPPVAFSEVVTAAFNQIRRYGAGDICVSTRLLEAVATIAAHTGQADQQAALHAQADAIRAGVLRGDPLAADARAIEAGHARAVRALTDAGQRARAGAAAESRAAYDRHPPVNGATSAGRPAGS